MVRVLLVLRLDKVDKDEERGDPELLRKPAVFLRNILQMPGRGSHPRG